MKFSVERLILVKYHFKHLAGTTLSSVIFHGGILMLKRILPLALALCMLTMAGCKKEQDRLSVDKGSEPSIVSETKPVTYKNPLTGVSGISEEKAKNRPVAIMINNISTAQPVQTGLNKADIIYETEVEGGITRLMAVFQDITTAEKNRSHPLGSLSLMLTSQGSQAIYVIADRIIPTALPT